MAMIVFNISKIQRSVEGDSIIKKIKMFDMIEENLLSITKYDEEQ